MKISTKVELGVISIIEIALYSENNETVTVYSIAQRQNISSKYLEQIITVLRQSSLIRGVKGSKGGYILNKPAEKITLRNILDALDITVLSDVDFSSQYDSTIYSTIDNCLWKKMTSYLQRFAENITLEDIILQYKKNLEEKQEQIMYYI